MSGHSKWATIKHKKGAADKARGKLFAKLIRQVEVAAREGGGDPDANPTLRTMFQKARDNSVPLDTIERAIERGTGELEGVTYEQITYEGYAPSGIAVLVEVLTDNRNRTGAEIKSLFTRHGGSLSEPGAVAWQFVRKGVVHVSGDVDEDRLIEVALEAGAEDVADEGGSWLVTTDPSDLQDVHAALEEAKIAFESADVTMLPETTIPLAEADAAKTVLDLIDVLDDQDDVQNVYTNFDIPSDVLEAVGALMVSIGEIAPGFDLAGTDGTPDGHRRYDLEEYRGSPVVLVFYPGDNTPVCTRQLNAYTDDIDEFVDVGAQVLAISPQDVSSHDSFAEKQGGFAFPLLADTDKSVGEAYGILGPLGFYRRSAFVLDGDGTIIYTHRAIAGLTFRPTTELVDAVRAASG